MSDDHQIVAHYGKNKQTPFLNSEITEMISTTQCRGFSAAINACICRAIVHFVSEHQSESSQFWRLQKAPKLIGYHSNIPWATAKLMLVL